MGRRVDPRKKKKVSGARVKNQTLPAPGSVAGLLGWELVLEARRNIDWPRRKLPKPEVVQVGSFRDADNKVHAWLWKHGIHESEWVGGQVRDGHGKCVGTVSYNGRIWLPDGREYKL